ncbi:Crp/Fnr family transcriptional regulator [uncultured Roseobacter sp.]|uniref:Crp/Fnr family transcriptional regulator n=1 Tax=uncultured Roseobacter sp. TaxID=114847 RepID=UPI00260C6158|nr:Crp/Fnr family transcriptional regulator [uncultured Roseobacter sp.]
MENLTTRNWLTYCAPETRTRIEKRLRSVRFSKGALIHQIGDRADDLFLIENGRVRFGASSEDGKELIVRDLEPGQWFGFIGCFGSGVRPNDAVSLAETKLLIISRREIEELGRSDPMLWRAIAGILATYVAHFYRTYENSVFLPLEKRLAATLKQLCTWQGTTTLNISQGELAAIMGITKEAVGLHLNALKSRGVVELGYRSISIQSVD